MSEEGMPSFISLRSISNLALEHKCRYLFINASHTALSVGAELGKEANGWIPLYLASDILSIDSVKHCNKSRIHAALGKRGLATKAYLPEDALQRRLKHGLTFDTTVGEGVKFSGIPSGNGTGVWFYSVYGVIQATIQYVQSQDQQHRLLSALMGVWKQHISDPALPDSLTNLSICNNEGNSMPMPEYLLKERCRSRDSFLSSETVASYVTPTGCLVRTKRLKTMNEPGSYGMEVPAVAFEVSVASEPPGDAVNLDQDQTLEMACESKSECDPDSHPTATFDNPGPDLHAKSQNRGQLNSGPSDQCKENTIVCTRCSRVSYAEGVGLSTVNLASVKPDLQLSKGLLRNIIEDLSLPEDGPHGGSLDNTITSILDRLLQVGYSGSEVSSDVPVLSGSNSFEEKLWSNESLLIVSRWIGTKFSLMVPKVVQTVEQFKEANVSQITDLPGEEQMIAELFPPAMSELFFSWMDLDLTEMKNKAEGPRNDEGQRSWRADSRRTISKGTYSLLLLLLEFSNRALVSGVAHVLYPRFADS